jgi:hypothetical protein
LTDGDCHRAAGFICGYDWRYGWREDAVWAAGRRILRSMSEWDAEECEQREKCGYLKRILQKRPLARAGAVIPPIASRIGFMEQLTAICFMTSAGCWNQIRSDKHTRR